MNLKKSIASISVDRLLLVLALSASVTAIGLWAWKRNSGTVDPQYLEAKYGISDAQEQRVPTPDGTMDATIVPVTLTNGQHAQLIIPRQRSEYPLYLRDSNGGMIPVSLADNNMNRDDFVRSGPVVYERPPVGPPPRARKRRTLEKEALIIAGGAGAGSAIGAVAGGGKGAAVGALSGGIAGLVYDLATRNR